MKHLHHFLCLGSEGGTYYIGEKELGCENSMAIIRLIESGKGTEVVKEIVEFSVQGRAAKQNPIIVALEPIKTTTQYSLVNQTTPSAALGVLHHQHEEGGSGHSGTVFVMHVGIWICDQ